MRSIPVSASAAMLTYSADFAIDLTVETE